MKPSACRARAKTIVYGIDSYTWGYDSSTGLRLTSPGGYVDQVEATLNSPYRKAINAGVNLRRLTECSWLGTFEPHRPDVLVLIGGLNDLILESVNLATLQSRASAVFTPALSAGVSVVYGDIMWSVFGAGDPRRATAQSFNAWLDSQGFAGVAHFSDDAGLADSSGVNFQADETHPNQAGHGIMAGYVVSALRYL